MKLLAAEFTISPPPVAAWTTFVPTCTRIRLVAKSESNAMPNKRMFGEFVAPDWREESQYPVPEKMSPLCWAWEFLRRNSEYQADWKDYVDRHNKIAVKIPKIKNFLEWHLERTEVAHATLSEKFKIEKNCSKYCNRARNLLHDHDRSEHSLSVFEPPRLEGESDYQHLQRTGGYTRTSLATHLGAKWGLKDIQPPNSNGEAFSVGEFFRKKAGNGVSQLSYNYRQNLKDVPSDKRENVVGSLLYSMRCDYFEKLEIEILGFDLTLPIDPQIKRVNKWLHQIQKDRVSKAEITMGKTKRYESARYLNYLRAYDANAARATPKEIAKVLKATADNDTATGNGACTAVGNWIRTAKNLVTDGYRDIPLAANVEEKRRAKTGAVKR
jgi:hypothetical protein